MDRIALETVQWHHLSDINEIQPLMDADYDVLREIGDVLRKHRKADRFGICLLHKHFDLRPGEVLVEDTDSVGRVSTTKPELETGPAPSTIETMWRFRSDRVSITECVVRCKYDKGHPRKHGKEGR